MSTFKTLGLADSYIESLARHQITTPTDIQIQSYSEILNRQDVWLSASTGSGKTLAYLLPLLAGVDSSTTDLQVAVLSPSQELAVQIFDCLRMLGFDKNAGIRSQLLIGNASAQRQKEKLKLKPHIVVGTLGRMLELGGSRKLKLHRCQCVVIDEADNMLAEDKIDDVAALIKMTPQERQLIFASATEKGDAFRIAESIGKQVEWISGQAMATDSKIEHYFVESKFHRKTDTLAKLLQAMQPNRALVFTHRNVTAEEVGAGLKKHALQATVLHGGMSKFERQMALKQFRKGTASILIASDVAARGMDIKGLTHVVNFDLPTLSDDYLHRSGRTGRMGSAGVTLSIMAEDEAKLIQRYQRDLKITIRPAVW